jgi:hypothetical protein
VLKLRCYTSFGSRGGKLELLQQQLLLVPPCSSFQPHTHGLQG